MFEFEAIGTTWKIDIYQDLSDKEKTDLLAKIKNRIDIFDKDYSRFRPDSLVTEMPKRSGKFTLPDDADKMISVYKKIYDLTNGEVTPLVGDLLVSAGYDADYSLVPKELKKPLKWEEVMEWKKPNLTMKKSALLDFGAGGKGYLVDIVGEVLEENGVRSYCVDAGGDMRYRNNSKPLKVGLEDPEDKTKVIGVVKILNESICGSAGNRRKWADFHHIISPTSLSSPKEILAAWAISSDTLSADILTTALFFVSPEKLQADFDFKYVIVYSDRSLKMSEDLDSEIFTV